MGNGITKNIGLIGFMGTGKSTIGKALAISTGRDFIDTDALIEERAQRTISQIFWDDGEEAFRQIESRVVKEVCERADTVISFGGGVVISPSNVDTIRKRNHVVLLRASIETIIERTGSDKQRPLLAMRGVEQITSLLNSRRTAYETTMDFAIDIDAMSTEQIVNEIKRRLGL